MQMSQTWISRYLKRLNQSFLRTSVTLSNVNLSRSLYVCVGVGGGWGTCSQNWKICAILYK